MEHYQRGYAPHSINCRGILMRLEKPRIMGILNMTPDSFFDGGRFNDESAAKKRVEEMLHEGVDIIDIGGASSRPQAMEVSEAEELRRISGIVSWVVQNFPQTPVSVDTYRSSVARRMLDMGVHMINDISAGGLDPNMPEVVRQYSAPYIAMHMKGTPATMQQRPEYDDVAAEVLHFFVEKILYLEAFGIVDIIIDPGFGFGKSLDHNYDLVENFEIFTGLGRPVLAGISRKSMLYKLVNTSPEDVLDLGSALHLKLLEKGASLLRVHDIAAARKIIGLFDYLSARNRNK